MAALVIGTAILGSASSWLMAFIPFLLAILGALAVGIATALVRGIPVDTLPLPGLILLVTAQLSYGLGLLAQLGLSNLYSGPLRRFSTPRPSLARDERHGHKSESADPTHLV